MAEPEHTVGEYESRLPDTATVTVRHAVDGTVQRKKRGPNKPKNPVLDERTIAVDPRVWAVARSIVTEHQRIEVISETEVRLVNK